MGFSKKFWLWCIYSYLPVWCLFLECGFIKLYLEFNAFWFLLFILWLCPFQISNYILYVFSYWKLTPFIFMIFPKLVHIFHILNLIPLNHCWGLKLTWIQWLGSDFQIEGSWNRHFTSEQNGRIFADIFLRSSSESGSSDRYWNHSLPHQNCDISIWHWAYWAWGHVLKYQSVFRLFWSDIALPHATPLRP